MQNHNINMKYLVPLLWAGLAQAPISAKHICLTWESKSRHDVKIGAVKKTIWNQMCIFIVYT